MARKIALRTGRSSRLCAQTDQATPLSLGELVDVIGFPIIGAFTPTLTRATYEGRGLQESVPPLGVTAEQVLEGDLVRPS